MKLLSIDMRTPLEIATDGKNLIVSPAPGAAREDFRQARQVGELPITAIGQRFALRSEEFSVMPESLPGDLMPGDEVKKAGAWRTADDLNNGDVRKARMRDLRRWIIEVGLYRNYRQAALSA